MKLLIATGNPSKLREYSLLFAETLVDAVSLKDIGQGGLSFEEVEETFKENAYAKAAFYCNATGMPTLAEDGGIMVDALGGLPGVRSRRWPGYEASDEGLVQLMLENLEGVEKSDRTAQFVVVAVFATPEGSFYDAQGVSRGWIAFESVEHDRGFPYRSLFVGVGDKEPVGRAESGLSEKLHHRRDAMEGVLPHILDYFEA